MGTADTKDPVARLPQLTLAQIRERLQELLQRVGDVSAYIEKVGDDGRVYLKTFAHRPACRTLPRPTLVKVAVPQERFESGRWAITQLNQALEQGVLALYGEIQGACLFPDGTIDHARTATIASEPPSDVEPRIDALVQPLERLSIVQIKSLIEQALQAAGDFSAYVEVDQSDRPVKFKTFSHKFNCAVLPAPTGLEAAVGKNSLGVASDVLTRFNTTLLQGEPFEYGEVDAECLPEGR